ncbi:MAG TPA: GNAT family N-acetyltransferase [Dongiaceae bacterium]|nr:GNAT family N-acetyltransferase [Dongiaceae bacterium]
MHALRTLALADIDAAAKIHRTSFDQRLPWLKGLHTPAEDRTFYRTRVFTSCAVWGAELEGRLLGIIAFRTDWVDQLYVLPDAQGRGIGSGLLGIAQAALPVLHLWTFQRNAAARRFYEARGFIVLRETDGSGNEEKEPDALYRWERP